MLRRHISARVLVLAAYLLMNAVILTAAFTDDKKYFWTLLLSVPLLLVAIWHMRRMPG